MASGQMQLEDHSPLCWERKDVTLVPLSMGTQGHDKWKEVVMGGMTRQSDIHH